MLINMRQRINVHHDSITTAILKKSENHTLSKKTLNKLVKISNTQFGLTKAAAKDIFIRNSPIKQNLRAMKLANELTRILPNISNREIKDKVESFILNSCPAAKMIRTAAQINNTQTLSQPEAMNVREFCQAYSHRLGSIIGDGAEAVVVEDKKNSNKVIKVFFNEVSKEEMVNQSDSFKRFYGENSAEIISGRALYMDKIKGAPLSKVNEFPAGAVRVFDSLIREMVNKGCAPSDMSENNFLYDAESNRFSPIDISTEKNNEVDINGFKYLTKYIINKTVNH